MYKIIFYSKDDKVSDIEKYIRTLAEKAASDKNARVNVNKILAYIKALEEYGISIGEPFIKHIDGKLWELRPLKNRIFFFYWEGDTFVLLHHFIKKTQKTPAKEIKQAKLKLKDFLESLERNEKNGEN